MADVGEQHDESTSDRRLGGLCPEQAMHCTRGLSPTTLQPKRLDH